MRLLEQILDKEKQSVIVVGLVSFWLFSVINIYGVHAGQAFLQAKTAADTYQAVASSDSSASFPVFLYFADSTNQFLIGEERSGIDAKDPVAFCRQLLEELAQGPLGDLGRTLPPTTTINAVFIEDKTAYVDFSEDIQTAHPGGIFAELMTIYSIVNTLVLNSDDVDQVKILIAGAEAETLSGHVDIRFPLHADMLLIR